MINVLVQSLPLLTYHPILISSPTLAQGSIFCSNSFPLHIRVLLESLSLATAMKSVSCLGNDPEEGRDHFIQTTLTKMSPVLKCEGVEVKTTNMSLTSQRARLTL